MDDTARLDPMRLESLVDAVARSAAARLRRLRDEAANRARAVVGEAEDRLAELEEAAKEIGRVRGKATETAYERDADQEIEGVLAGAFDRLFDRFRQRVRLAIATLPEDGPTYEKALGAWARRARAAMTGPTEVFTAPRDRETLYDQLIEAGAEDFRVLTERTMRSGFVLRDLDGRTLFDCRPDALVEQEREALEKLLRDAVPATG